MIPDAHLVSSFDLRVSSLLLIYAHCRSDFLLRCGFSLASGF